MTNNPQQYGTAYYNEQLTAQNNLTRWLAEDDTGKFTNTIWNPKVNVSGATADELLNGAVPGLEWFERALVRYHRVHDVLNLDEFSKIEIPADSSIDFVGWTIDAAKEPLGEGGEMYRIEGRWFDQQRKMSVESLRGLADKLKAAASGSDVSLDTVTQEVAGVANAVPEVWQGPSGDAAQDHMAGFHSYASQQSQYVQALASALDGVPEVILEIVRDKAVFIAKFASDQMPVAGHAMKLGGGSEDPVSQIISIATGWVNTGETNEVVQDQFHTTITDHASDTCKKWLQEHFGPAVREAFIAFVHQCAAADYYIKKAYQPVTDLLDGKDTTTVPKVQEQPKSGDQKQGSGTDQNSNSNTSTASVDQSKVPSTSTTPTSVNPSSSQSNPLSTLLSQAEQTLQTASSGVSQLTSALQSGASQLSSVLQSGMSGIFGNTTAAASSTNGSKNLASFNIGGEKLSMTQGSDGSITTTVTGLDGKSQKYTMGIKNGVPYFTPGGGDSSTQSSTTHNSTSSTGSGTGTDSAGSGSYSTSGTGGGSATQSVTSDSSQQSGSSVPSTGSSTTTTTSAYDSSTTASSSSSGTSSTGSMGHMPSTGGGGGKGSEGEHKSTGVVQSKPMWTKNPGSDRKPVIDAAAPQTSGGKFGIDDLVERYAPNLDFEPAAVYELDPAASPNPRQGRDSSHQPSPPPAAPVPAPTPAPAPAPTAAPRTDGVKIEIDMGG
ncbi:WXG100 family type VII secretion target [Nocardia jiangxiensis]|uniref:WXG100 family type VII secretion target n=1 Tax=Nocardia jiangxiensis TaxID=282685 RepID=A0ABW6RWW9_9NOCA|nr:hypothetical protein [Nocardia jiangxiensis]